MREEEEKRIREGKKAEKEPRFSGVF